MENKKHAFLILANAHLESLLVLLSALDCIQNDIYIHIDKKTKDFDEQRIVESCKYSKVYLVKRVPVYWADSSMIKAEMELFKAASINGYHYYHLISETHFPLMTSNDISEKFKEENRLFIDCHEENEADPFLYKVKYYYPFKRYYRNIVCQTGLQPCFRKAITKIYRTSISLQKRLDMSRLDPNITYIKGNQWVSLPHDFVEYLLTKEKEILKQYHHTDCSDEIFIPTIAFNSEFKDRMYRCSNTYVDWNRGRPYTFRDEDYEELISSGAMFARKIIYEKNPDLVNRLLNNLAK